MCTTVYFLLLYWKIVPHSHVNANSVDWTIISFTTFRTGEGVCVLRVCVGGGGMGVQGGNFTAVGELVTGSIASSIYLYHSRHNNSMINDINK